MTVTFKGKKGQTDSSTIIGKQPFIIIGLFVIVVVAIIFAALTLKYKEAYVPLSEDLQRELLIQRLTNVCFISGTPLGQGAHHSIIDASKFNRAAIDECFQTPHPPWMIVELEAVDGFMNFQRIVLYQGVTKYEETRYVLIRDAQGVLHPGFLQLRR